MWSKGAVVIVKHGDQEWADSIEQALAIRRASEKELKELEDLKRHKNLSKIHDDKFTDLAIKALKIKYGEIKPIPKWLDILLAPWSLLVYGVSLFADKYLVIKG